MSARSCCAVWLTGPLPRNPGFSLVEVLVVLALVATLAALAWPSYRETVYSARRTDARIALLGAAQVLESCHVRHERYSHPDCTVPEVSPNGHYRITEPQPREDAGFRLRATPIGAQAGDSRSCAWLELDHRGQRTVSGEAGTACWQGGA